MIEEDQSQWLAFLGSELDFLDIFPVAVHRARRSSTASCEPALAARGIQHESLLRPKSWWVYFNMEDPVVGGYTPERIALRRAIGDGLRQRRLASACC